MVENRKHILVMVKIEIKQTRDGSSTLYRPDMDETYHSIHGAIQESKHVFIKNGLEYFLQKMDVENLDIFELGFGTGLNALLSLHLSICQTLPINYYASEKYVLSSEVIDQLNYSELIDPKLDTYFAQMHASTHNDWTEITKTFRLMIDTNDVLIAEIPTKQFDIIYFDAFAPNKQPELWTPEIFEKMYQIIRPEGILVTYCAKGQVKRDLKSVGFEVESLPGPPGKREMIRAIKS